LYFAIYQNEKGKRSFDTIQLNVVIERLKQNLVPVPEVDSNGNTLVMYLSPNDLVYLPSIEESDNDFINNFISMSDEKIMNYYKFVSCTGGEGHFVPVYYAKEIVKNEMGTNNKSERPIKLYGFDKTKMIKDHCIKLIVDRLGIIKPFQIETNQVRTYE